MKQKMSKRLIGLMAALAMLAAMCGSVFATEAEEAMPSPEAVENGTAVGVYVVSRSSSGSAYIDGRRIRGQISSTSGGYSYAQTTNGGDSDYGIVKVAASIQSAGGHSYSGYHVPNAITGYVPGTSGITAWHYGQNDAHSVSFRTNK